MTRIDVFSDHLEITTGDDSAEIWNVKQIPGRVYDAPRDVWVVPIRAGVAMALKNIYHLDEVSPNDYQTIKRVEDSRPSMVELLAPPPPGSIDPSTISAEVALELATLYHLYKYHNGDRSHYAWTHNKNMRNPHFDLYL